MAGHALLLASAVRVHASSRFYVVRRSVASFLLLSFAVAGCASKGDPSTTTGNNNGGGGTNDGVHLTGSVTGLLGFGLTMKTAGAADQAPAPLAPGFDFGLPPKTAYSITITAQPTNPWQTCTVTNATGTATASNTSVKVDCVTNTYAIKGNISGLTGSGLVVQLRAGVTLPIAVGAPTFAFNSVPSGTVFVMTVVAQPTGQTCLVNTGNGTLGGADVTNIAVTCTSPGFTVGGNAVSVSGPGLTIRRGVRRPHSRRAAQRHHHDHARRPINQPGRSAVVSA